MSISKIISEVKKGLHDEMNIVKKSAKQAVNDTFGIGTAAGVGVGVANAKKEMSVAKAITTTAKDAFKGSALDYAISFTGHMISNQLAYDHKYK
ncbi:hypothetical protein H5P36_06965 [Bacillus sp. APMAM]|nr:hypothetical protein [Bacillus sp. APMAM]RTZ56619.1 hypothetical protein EKO25_06620 [Bacillus sp. SAJ1]